MKFIALVLFSLFCVLPVHAAEMSDAEVRTAHDWVANSFEIPGQEPFSFSYNGTASTRFLGLWRVSQSKEALDSRRVRHDIRYRDAASGLEILVEAVVYSDFAAVEWVLRFRNTGSKDTPILRNIWPLDTRMGAAVSTGDYLLGYAAGSAAKESDFQPKNAFIEPGRSITLKPFGGRSSGGGTSLGPEEGVLPFFNIAYPGGGGFTAAVGWTGQWNATFSRSGGPALRVYAGMERVSLRLHPGEEIRTPSMLMLFWTGNDSTRGRTFLRRLLLSHYTPRSGGKLQPAPVAASSNGTIPMEAVSEANMKQAIANIAAHRLPIDTWWVDAGWYAGKNIPWCDPAHLGSADFNGDRKLDLLCSTDEGKHLVALSGGDGSFAAMQAWPATRAWCDPKHVSTGDFNGDNKADLICSAEDGTHRIAFSRGNGAFSSPGPWNQVWCEPRSVDMADFNGDRKLDLICNAHDGRHFVALSRGDGSFAPMPAWPPSSAWCDPTHVSTGDFNADGKADLICSAEDGRHIIAFSDGDGAFSSPGWWNQAWCEPRSLDMADFNGDRKLDLICNAHDGRHFVALSRGDGSFAPLPAWPANSAWCDPTHVSTGDFNADNKADLICSAEDGRHIIAFSDGNGAFSSSEWSNDAWCDPAHLRLGDYSGAGKTGLSCHSDDGRHIIAFSNGRGGFLSPGWWTNSNWAENVGNFEPDPVRFPGGMKPVADAAHAEGLKFLLWFEPERAMPGTWMYDNHFDWLIPPPADLPADVDYMYKDGFHLVNFGLPEARELLRRKISAMIAGTGIDIYRHDFNMYPLYYWRSQDEPDRQGMTEIRYVEGLYAFLNGLRRDHPETRDRQLRLGRPQD